VKGFFVARVKGPSMSPTWDDGDLLLARRLQQGEKVTQGDVVIARFPALPDKLVIKRAMTVLPDKGVWLLSDYWPCDDDSRTFGFATPVARIVTRLWRSR
jgi:signal peptidase I